MALTKVSGPLLHGSNDNLGNYNINNITGAAATFSSVSVGGTLTYDDVTNVDSVGIVTARGGLHVGVGGTIINAMPEDNGSLGIGQSIFHIGDTDTNFGFDSDNQIVFNAGGNEKLKVDSSGNVYFAGNRSGNDRGIIYNDSNGFGIYGSSSGTNHRNIIFFSSSSGSSEKVRITSGGSVAIGTDGAVSNTKLDVLGNVVFGPRQHTGNPGNNTGIASIRGHFVNAAGDFGQLYFSNSESSGGGTGAKALISGMRDGVSGGNYGAGLAFHTEHRDPNTYSPTLRMLISGLGIIGINTNGPTAYFDIATDDGTYDNLRLRRIDSGSSNNSDWSLKPYGGNLFFRTAGSTDKVVFTDDPNVGIGTAAPSGALHTYVTGATQRSYFQSSHGHSFIRTLAKSTNENSGLEFYSGTSNIANITGVGTGGLLFEVGGSQRLKINSNGSILGTPEGSTNNPYFLIDTSGDSVRFNAKKTSGDNEFRFLIQESGSEDEALRITHDGYLHLGNSGHGTNKVGGQAVTGNDVDAYFKLLSNTNNTWSMQIRNDTNTGSNGMFLRAGNNNTSTYTIYATGTNEHYPSFVVRGDGNVGIGSSSPAERLQIFGNAEFNAYDNSNGQQGYYSPKGLIIGNAFDNNVGDACTDDRNGIIWQERGLDLDIGVNNQFNTKFNYQGRVGIAHSAPNARLHIGALGTSSAVGDETNPALQIGNTTNYRFAIHTTSEGAIIGNKNGDDGILFKTKLGNNGVNYGNAMRLHSRGYRESAGYHYGPWTFTNDTAKSTITIGSPGDGNYTIIKFILTIMDSSYRQNLFAGEYVVFVSDANGGPGTVYQISKIWDKIGSGNWSGGSVTVSVTSGGAVQVTASNSHNDAGGDAYIHILDVIGDRDGSTISDITS